jgi:hypothetical protein
LAERKAYKHTHKYELPAHFTQKLKWWNEKILREFIEKEIKIYAKPLLLKVWPSNQQTCLLIAKEVQGNIRPGESEFSF